MTSLTSGRFQPPLSLTEGNTVDFVFRLSNNGTLFTPPLTPVWIFGIKDATTPNGDFLIQVNSATVASGVYTFVVELASAELQTWLATATSQSYAAIQITDSANDIATAPLLCQIAPNQNDTGTTPTSANGTLSVAAGKTVTFPQSLTFPSALGTNGFQLSTDGAGTLTWTASGALTDGDKGDITVSNSGATFTIDNDVVGLAQLAHMATARVVGRTTPGNGSPELLTISGTGSVAMTTSPTFVTPTLGVASATSLQTSSSIDTTGASAPISTAGATSPIYTLGQNAYIYTQGANAYIYTIGADASIYTQGADAYISTEGLNAYIRTEGANAYIQTRSTFNLYGGTYTTTLSHAATADRAIAFPDVSGTVAVTSHSATTTHAMFSAGAAGYTTRAIATADIASALTTPGAIGGTTPSTVAATTTSLKGATSGVVTLAAPAVATTATLTFAPSASVIMTPPATNFTAARTDAAQTFTGTQTFSSAPVIPAGNNTTPSIGFASDVTSGLWDGGSTGRIGFITAGVNRMSLAATAFNFASNITINFNSATNIGGYNDTTFRRGGVGLLNICAGTASSDSTTTANAKVGLGCAVITPTTVANLPTSPAAGWVATVNDATAPTIGLTVTGGAAAFALVCYNGSAWKVVAI